MTRAPFQVLVFPYYIEKGCKIKYAIFKRTDGNYFQAITGGGEDNELPIEAARRESWEEAKISRDSEFIKLDSQHTVPVEEFQCYPQWGKGIYVIPEYCFGVKVTSKEIKLSKEHYKYLWVTYEKAVKLLKWDSNKNALWELNKRLQCDR